MDRMNRALDKLNEFEYNAIERTFLLEILEEQKQKKEKKRKNKNKKKGGNEGENDEKDEEEELKDSILIAVKKMKKNKS